jgi:formylglycine-generating enzyme required for sulfatase activity
MLTGLPPFTGPTPTAVLMKRLSAAPTPLAKVRPDTPPALRDAIDGMLAQNPEERFQSAAEVVRALGGATPASGGHPTAEFVTRRRQRAQRNRLMAAGGGVIVVGGLLAYALMPRGPRQPPPNPIDAGMAVIPAGSYTIGTNEGGDSRLKPAHQVQLAAFGLDVHEVTVGDYKVFVDSGRADAPWTSLPLLNLPVTGVRWSDATNYCAWKHKDGGVLPSEEQWEAAARGVAARRYPWTGDLELGRANIASERRNGPAAVGSYPRGSTPEGVEDMIGNVWEWTSSPMGAYPGGQPIPGLLPLQYYVIKGGAWNTPDPTAMTRGYNAPVADRAVLDKTGFRCAMPIRGATPSR